MRFADLLASVEIVGNILMDKKEVEQRYIQGFIHFFLQGSPPLLHSPIRVQQHLRVPLHPLIKLAIRLGRLIDADIMADDKTGVGAAGDDQVAQVAVVFFDVALAGADCETLWKVRQSRKGRDEGGSKKGGNLLFRRVCQNS